MKRINIEAPDVLLEVATMMKKDEQSAQVRNVATVWRAFSKSGLSKCFDVTLEIGKKAMLYRERGNTRVPMGEVSLKLARELAAEKGW